MRATILPAAALILAGAAAHAQENTTQTLTPPMHHHHHHHHRHALAATGAGAEKPIDKGPDTPEANSAYQGGGVVLQGQPGGPAPMPQATPPGQEPANSVPPR